MKQSVSIVVPVYNVEKFLPACLDSLGASKGPDLEIVVVNDGSTDRSGDVAAEYAARDSRIRVITQTNGGVAVARNTGVESATGELIMFVDSDDVVHPGLVGHLYQMMTDNDADVASCRGTLFTHDPVWKAQEELNVLSGGSAVEELLYQRIVNGPWAKMYRASVLGSKPFEPGMRVGEDLLANVDALRSARRVVVSDAVLYGYRQGRDGSAMSGARAEDRLRVVKKLEALKGQGYDRPLGNRLFAEALYIHFENSQVPAAASLVLEEQKKQVLCDRRSLPQLRAYALASLIHPKLATWFHQAH